MIKWLLSVLLVVGLYGCDVFFSAQVVVVDKKTHAPLDSVTLTDIRIPSHSFYSNNYGEVRCLETIDWIRQPLLSHSRRFKFERPGYQVCRHRIKYFAKGDTLCMIKK